jgi:hypothetical protein
MRHQGTAAVGLIAALAMVLGGCGSFKPAWEPGERDQALQPQSIGRIEPKTIDDLFAEIAWGVPGSGFGGAFFNPNGTISIYLRDQSKKTETVAALRALFSQWDIPSLDKVTVLQGRYDFSQLAEWKKLTTLANIPGVIMVDADERGNNLFVGIVSIELKLQVQQELIKLGIPIEAVIIEEVRPPRFLDTLEDRRRPLIGGIKVEAANMTSCTMGPIATRSGVRGFLMNSHCTYTKFGPDSGLVYQPTSPGSGGSANDLVGTEYVDPLPFTGGRCPSGRTCRWSDSSFIKLASGVQASLGYIAKTAALGSKTIVGNYQILGTFTYSAQGQMVYKVGKATGLTRGVVNRTCWDYLPSSGVALLCQRTVLGETSTPADHGDSGSPVFHIHSGDSVYLHGMVWGGVPWEFFFSGIGEIQGDLGRLITCTTGLC